MLFQSAIEASYFFEISFERAIPRCSSDASIDFLHIRVHNSNKDLAALCRHVVFAFGVLFPVHPGIIDRPNQVAGLYHEEKIDLFSWFKQYHAQLQVF